MKEPFMGGPRSGHNPGSPAVTLENITEDQAKMLALCSRLRRFLAFEESELPRAQEVMVGWLIAHLVTGGMTEAAVRCLLEHALEASRDVLGDKLPG